MEWFLEGYQKGI